MTTQVRIEFRIVTIGAFHGVNYIPATAGSDYVSESMKLTFPAGSSHGTMQCLNVSIVRDSDALEGDETFTTTLTTTDTVILEGDMTTITIIDGGTCSTKNNNQCPISLVNNNGVSS